MNKHTHWLLVPCAVLLVANTASAQINIDCEGGNGPPSSSFGGAAGTPGFWNMVGNVRGPVKLFDVHRRSTFVAYSAYSYDDQGYNSISYLQHLNTGDYARLLNDALTVGGIRGAAHFTVTFDRLPAGSYDVYTYAANVWLSSYPVKVNIPEADKPVQLVTGPMPGNAFEVGVTHCIHRVTLTQLGSIHIDFVHDAGATTSDCINGFQIVPVADSSSLRFLDPFFVWSARHKA